MSNLDKIKEILAQNSKVPDGFIPTGETWIMDRPVKYTKMPNGKIPKEEKREE